MQHPVSDFRAGLVDVLPAAVAVVPFGLLLGARAVEQGLSVAEVTIMSVTVFAGSAQFVAIDIWTHPAPWAVLAFATLLVNVRHVLMGTSLAGKMGAFRTGARPIAMMFMVDEVWAMAERRAIATTLTPAYYAGLAGFLYLNWIAWTTTGAWLGRLVSDPEALGFDFAFTAIFLVLLTGFWRGPSTALVLAASSAAAVAVKIMTDGPWYIVAGALAGIVVAAVLPPRTGEDRQ